MCVYEVCETTDDERYFPLGIFETREMAIFAINEADKYGVRMSDNGGEFESISIFEREFGWTEHGTCIMTRNREVYCDEDGECYWRNVPV